MNLLHALPLFLLSAIFPAYALHANNVRVDSVQVVKSANNTVWHLEFDVAWDNSWKQDHGRDAIWIFVKYRKWGTATWHHAYLDVSGHSTGNCGSGCEIEIGKRDPIGNPSPNPVLGVFFYKARAGANYHNQTCSSTNVRLKWNYAGNAGQPLSANDQVEVHVYSMEMVYVKGGEFVLGHPSARNALMTPNRSTVKVGANATVATQNSLRASSTSVWSGSGNTVSGQITVDTTACPNGMLVASYAWRADKGSATWSSGFQLVPGGIGSKGKQEVEIAYKTANTPGVQSLTVTNSKTPEGAHLTLAHYCQVTQSAPYGKGYGNNDVTTYTLAMDNSSPGDRLFGALSLKWDSPLISAFGGSIHALAISATNNIHSCSSDTIAQGTGNVGLRWTWTDTKDFALAGTRLRPPAGTDLSQMQGITIQGSSGISLTAGSMNTNFPTGYDPFYCMKYEVCQDEYMYFLNTLSIAQQTERTWNSPFSPSRTSALYQNNADRNGLDIRTPAGSTPAVYGCNWNDSGSNPDGFDSDADGCHIACNYLSWADLAAYLDWAGLRPMTELEYEKACRGLTTTPSQFPWGDSQPLAPTSTSQIRQFDSNTDYEDPDPAGPATNVNAGGAMGGPLRTGCFARGNGHSTRTRKLAGASLTGVLDLAGNLWEMVITVGNEAGRSFDGSHGDGSPDTPESWPGYGMTGEFPGVGARGGAWNSPTANWKELEVSDRSKALRVPGTRDPAYGGRGVRRTAQSN